MAASKTQMRWNHGLDGEPSAPRAIERRSACITEGCGALAGDKATPKGFTRVSVRNSPEPARDYCSRYCVHYGTALAEIRGLRGAS